MNLKEHVHAAVDQLDEAGLHQVAEYINLISRLSKTGKLDKIEEENLANLYKEFDEKDKKLANDGMFKYQKKLKNEDKK